MANRTGVKWNLGGAKARNQLSLQFDGWANLLDDFEASDREMKAAVTKAVEKATEMITEDTKDATTSAYFPAGGKYSSGDTAASIVDKPRAEWSGTVVETGFGFDKTQKGAGGWLITGTPKMRPDYKLENIYVAKAYLRKAKNMLDKSFRETITILKGAR